MAADDESAEPATLATAAATVAAAAPPEKKPSTDDRPRKRVYQELLRRLADAGDGDASSPAFAAELWAHLRRLPTNYSTDVNVERAEDVLMHMRLLEQARHHTAYPVFSVRLAQRAWSDGAVDGDDVPSSDMAKRLVHPPPAFNSSTNLAGLALEDGDLDCDPSVDSVHHYSRPMHEITIASNDKPKLLNQVTAIFGDLDLDVQEAQVFSTSDKYLLDVFVVSGWHSEETEMLKKELEKRIRNFEPKPVQSLTIDEDDQPKDTRSDVNVEIPSDGNDVWEIDMKSLKFEKKVASGSYGDLYRGTYRSQDVAIKVLKPERVSEGMLREFAQEVYIMRKVRHRNVVQFIGACTRLPSLCIITEFMSGGSVYDYIHKQKGSFKLPDLIRVALDVAKGMNYLHQSNIIHRDLKAANLLMDEYKVVKVADFGVARVMAEGEVMTAETGTYRWMAPEVLDHKPYDLKADVFSFAIVVWELLTNKIPYEHLTPMQAAVGVVQKNLRPTIPKDTHPKLVELLEKCWDRDPEKRPDFSFICDSLELIAKEVGKPEDRRKMKPSKGGFLSSFKRGH